MLGDLYAKVNRYAHAMYRIVDWKEQRMIRCRSIEVKNWELI